MNPNTKSFETEDYRFISSENYSLEKDDFEFECPFQRDSPKLLKECRVCQYFVGLMNACYSNSTTDSYPTILCCKKKTITFPKPRKRKVI